MWYVVISVHLVQGVGEVGFELLEAGGNVPALLAPVDARHEQVDEPRQAVLVHGLYVGQVRDAEEEDLARVGDRRVAAADLLHVPRESEKNEQANSEVGGSHGVGSFPIVLIVRPP